MYKRIRDIWWRWQVLLGPASTPERYALRIAMYRRWSALMGQDLLDSFNGSADPEA